MAETVEGTIQSLDGRTLLEMFEAGVAALDANVDAINALNVFPVPDGDTGTNMSLSARSALEAARRVKAKSASATAEALASGALMGARGNSGVFLSQIIAGFAHGVRGKRLILGQDLARGLRDAAAAAYRAVSNPVEGTILTVVREVAEAARPTARASLSSVMTRACETARAAVARTPLLLQVLRDNGVVDAGGQGFRVMLEGMRRYVAGERDAVFALASPRLGPLELARPGTHAPDDGYGFCTEFLIKDSVISLGEIRSYLESTGRSVLVVGEQSLIRVHLHASDPAPILAFARATGSIANVKVEDMDAQHQAFKTVAEPSISGEVGVVAIAIGSGMMSLFRSLGAAVTLAGGQRMNPSSAELSDAFVRVPCDHVIVLPNNENIIATAEQAARLAPSKHVHLVESEDMAQGVSAITTFNFEAPWADNVRSMQQALTTVKTAQVTRAVRQARIDGIDVLEGQAIGLTAGRLLVAEETLSVALEKLLGHMGVDDGSVVTLYHGSDIGAEEAELVRHRIQQRFDKAEVETFDGGQPHYHYLLAVE